MRDCPFSHLFGMEHGVSRSRSQCHRTVTRCSLQDASPGIVCRDLAAVGFADSIMSLDAQTAEPRSSVDLNTGA